MNKNHKFELGVRLRDRVSGFQGIAMAVVEFYNGCVRYLLEPSVDKDGKVIEGQYVDVQQLEQVDQGLNAQQKRPDESTGGSVNPGASHIPRQ